MIPFFSLNRQNKVLEKELEGAIKETLHRGVFILGEKVTQFEKAFAKYLGISYGVGVASGTDALSLALLAIGAGPGDEVVVPANAYPIAFAVTSIGAIPRLVDIDAATYNLDPAKLPSAICAKTKAIIAVHLYGQPADMGKIMEVGRKYKLPIIEDCAQAHGATLSGRKVGSIGDLGCFSFYPTKNLGGFGDGGMVVTSDKKLADKARLLRMYGERKRYDSILLGRNSRLDELQAAILLVKLRYLDKWNERRREIAEKYLNQLNVGDLKLPAQSASKHVYHLFVVRAKSRDELKEYLLKKGIQTAIHYPIPIHLVPSFSFLGYKKGDFPESEKASEEVLSLPMFPELTDREVERIVEEIGKFYA
jgi:hypothetical protein